MLLQQEVILKYAVEVEIPRSTALMGVLDPLLERIVYQDIPSNLSAVRQRVEQARPGRLKARDRPRSSTAQSLCKCPNCSEKEQETC